MSNVTVIIPMHVGDKESVKLLNTAIETVPKEYKIIVSVGKEMKKIDGINKRENLVICSESQETSFCELVNAAVEMVDTDWFSILEFDDTYTSIWKNNIERYMEFMPDVSVFMTLEDIIDFNSGKYIGFGNAEAYASAFSNEIGYLDNDCLQNYFDFYLTGSVFNTNDWKNIGGLKPSIKLTFWYEWLLRLTNKGKKVFVMPKICYKHMLGRKDSLVDIYKNTMSEEETQYYFDLAKREYYFDPSVQRENKEYKKED